MRGTLGETIEHVGGRLDRVLEAMRESLAGRSAFTGEDVKKLRQLLAEMEPVILRSEELRRTRPEIAAQLDRYKEQLLELQKTVEQMRVTLMVQKTSLEAARTQVDATSQWCSAFQQTR
jgi:seryl-tRNA synthetase